MRVVYFLSQPSNINSDAAYNRISLFCKGLERVGVRSSIMLIPSNNSKYRLFSILKKISNYFLIIKYIQNCSRNDFLIFYGLTPYFSLFPIINRRCKILVELNEYPWFVRNQSNHGSWQLKYIKYAKGLITCSSYLRSYYSDYMSNNSHIFISPLIVDVCSFDIEYNTSINTTNNNTIIYCGNFGNNKDGVPILIDAFAIFLKTFPNYKLYLLGGGNNDVEKELYEKVKIMGLSGSVVFTGFIPHNQLKYHYQKASIFALARPSNKQAEGGIPSKLAEYMSMKRPCVITEVGDIPTIFEKGVDCYMACPSSVDDFARCLIKCASSNNRKMVINAYQKIQKFDYKVQAENLYLFLKNNVHEG